MDPRTFDALVRRLALHATRRGVVRASILALGAAALAKVSQSGSAQDECSFGEDRCYGSCVDTSSDSDHCGYCGNACPSGASCWGGSCQCSSGELCGSRCIDTSSDPYNCGFCGNSCGAGGQICQWGSCTCTSEQDLCGYGISARCVDTSNNPAHCGYCGIECAFQVPGSSCRGGACVCGSGYEPCAGGCTNVSSDPNNCGGCGIACPAGAFCSRGSCQGGSAMATETAARPGPPPQTAESANPAELQFQTSDGMLTEPTSAIPTALPNIPNPRGDWAMTGRMPGPPPTGAIQALWRFDSDSDSDLITWLLHNDLLVVRDGPPPIMTGSDSLLAIDALTGTERWRIAGEGRQFTTSNQPTALGDTIYLDGDGPQVFGLAASSGIETVRIPSGANADSPRPDGILLESDGILFARSFGQDNAEGMLAINPQTQRLAWGSSIYDVELLAIADGVIFAAGYASGAAFERDIFAIAADSGAAMWRTPGLAPVCAAASDGRVYLSFQEDENNNPYVVEPAFLIALDAGTGTQDWRLPTRNPVVCSAVADGVVYATLETRAVTAMDSASGVAAWAVDFGASARVHDIVVAGDELIAAVDLRDDSPATPVAPAAQGDGLAVIGLDLATGSERWRVDVAQRATFQPNRCLLVSGGVVFVTVQTVYNDERNSQSSLIAYGSAMPAPSAATGADAFGSPLPDAESPILIETPSSDATAEIGIDGPILIGESPTSGISGDTFTSPAYGFSLSWDPTWTVDDEVLQGDTETLTLANGVSTFTFTASPFAGDPSAALQQVRNRIAIDTTFGDFGPVSGPDGAPLQRSDANRAWAVFQATATDTGAGELAIYIDCRSIPPGDAMLSIVQVVPLGAFNDQDPARRALLGSLVMPTAAD